MQSEVSPCPALPPGPHLAAAAEASAPTPLTPPRPLFVLSPQQIRKLRRELESSQEKVATLTSQLSANVSPCGNPRGTCGAGAHPWEIWVPLGAPRGQPAVVPAVGFPLSLALAPLPQEKSPLLAPHPVPSGSGSRVLTHVPVSPRPTWWQLSSRAW